MVIVIVMVNIIFHLDMNSYFASVEQQDNPVWRGKPLGVCEHLGGIIIAASIEAKRWGIKTGTPVWEARKLYPKIILTKTSPDRYRLYIKRVIKIVSDYTAFVEQYSIDELFADMSKACNIRISNNKFQISNWTNPFEEAIRIAKEIKRRMKKEVADYLTCSIGIAENKLVAKIASDMKKPDGIVAIFPSCHSGIPHLLDLDQNFKKGEGYPESRSKLVSGSRLAPRLSSGLGRDDTLILSKSDLYHRLKLTDIPGIARRQEKNLNALGVKTLLDLKNYPLSRLVARFGINGYHLHKMGQLEGSWKPEVEQEEEIKSIGHMYTLPQEYRKKEFFAPVLYKLCEMVARRLRKQGLMGNVIHFYIHPAANFYGNARVASSANNKTQVDGNLKAGKISGGASDKNYEGFGQSKKLGFFVYDGREIFLQAMKIFENVSRNLSGLEFKLIGVTIAGLCPNINQLSLFGDEERLKRVVVALDKINTKYGDFSICRVPILSAKEVFQDSVGFGRIKEK